MEQNNSLSKFEIVLWTICFFCTIGISSANLIASFIIKIFS